MDEPGPARPRSVRRLPLQRYHGQLGTQATHLGDADGQLTDRERRQISRHPRAGLVFGAGGRAAQQADGRRRTRRGTMRPIERPQLLPSKSRTHISEIHRANSDALSASYARRNAHWEKNSARVYLCCHCLIYAFFILVGTQVVFALNQTLHHQESLRAGDRPTPYTTDDLIKHYNCGDLNAVIFSHDTAQVLLLDICAVEAPHSGLNNDFNYYYAIEKEITIKYFSEFSYRIWMNTAQVWVREEDLEEVLFSYEETFLRLCFLYGLVSELFDNCPSVDPSYVIFILKIHLFCYLY